MILDAKKDNAVNEKVKGTMEKRSPQEQEHALSHPQTHQFHNPCHPANSAFANKPHKTTHSPLIPLILIILPAPILIPTLIYNFKIPATLITKTQS